MALFARSALFGIGLLTACASVEIAKTPPPSPATLFNESSYNLGLPVRWHDDGDTLLEEGELAGLESLSPRAGFEKGNRFLQKLIEKINWMTDHRQQFLASLTDVAALDRAVETTRTRRTTPEARQAYRRALRNRELATRHLAEIPLDFSGLPAADQRAIRLLLDTAMPEVESIYLAQMDPQNLRYREEIIERGDPEDLFALHQMGGVACLTDGIDPLCSAHPDSPAPTPNQGLWPSEFRPTDFDQLLSEASTHPEIEQLKSPFVYREHASLNLMWKSLNDYPPTRDAQRRLITALREASRIKGINRSMARFMEQRSGELAVTDQAYPFFDGDIRWIEMDAPWDLTLGYYEEYHSPFEVTAIMEGFIGVVDKKRARQGEKFRDLLPWMEQQIAAELPDYRRRDFKALPPLRFINAVAAGDGRARYVPAAFYLPNIPPHGRTDLSKKVFLTNSATARFEGIYRPMAELTMDAAQLRRLNADDIAVFVVGHENAHGAGPGRKYVVREDATKKMTADDLLKEHSSALEEARADLLGLASLTEAVRRGLITRESAENAAIGLVASFNRGLALGVEDSHGKGAFVEFTSLSEQGGIIETPEGRYAANLENGRIFEVARELGNRMTRIQVTGNYQEYDAWYRHSVSNLPKTMKEKFLPQLKKMPKDFFPYYRLRFSPGI